MSAFSGFHKVSNNTRVSLFCDCSSFDFWGKPVIWKHLKMARKMYILIWRLKRVILFDHWLRSLYPTYFIVWRVYNFFVCLLCWIPWKALWQMYAWIECRHDIALQLLCVYLDVKHLWPLFTAPCYLVFQTCNSISLNHKVLLTTVQFFLPSFSFARKCHCWTAFAKPW